MHWRTNIPSAIVFAQLQGEWNQQSIMITIKYRSSTPTVFLRLPIPLILYNLFTEQSMY